MTSVETEEFQKYRTPRENRTALVDPSISELTELLVEPLHLVATGAAGAGVDGELGVDSSASSEVLDTATNRASASLKKSSSGQAANQRRSDSLGPLEFCGKSLDVARFQARKEVVNLARSYTRAYRDVECDEVDAATRLVMSGHQPELFHAGVWFKNFLLSRLANAPGTIAINFLVDNDVCRSAGIRVPTTAANGNIVAQSVPFDAQRDSIPWELRRCESAELWESFPKRIGESVLASSRPLLNELWPLASEALKRTHRIGTAVAEGRHKIEEQLGLSTLEVPLSSLVSTRAFARFSIQLLSELPRFQDCYNNQLHRYRVAHHIRNHAHPVPALEQEAGWLEAPWWIYRDSAPKRQKMWVKLLNNQLMLSDRAGWQATIDGRLDCDNAATQWLDLLADGICLRPRALLTTMYLRMMVSDLFIHGIGGGKYDQLTNAIMQDFFGVYPPPMAVATATLQLPIAGDAAREIGAATSRRVTEQRIRDERERVWKMRFNADSDHNDSQEFQRLTERKQQLIEAMPQRGEKWEWHREITAVNNRLRELSAPQINDAKRTIEQLTNLERQQRVVESREFSFCLFEKSYIANALAELAAK